MIQHYSNPALDAELAYRRELAMLAGKGTRSARPRRRSQRRRERADRVPLPASMASSRR